jgi:hypothetical protein
VLCVTRDRWHESIQEKERSAHSARISVTRGSRDREEVRVQRKQGEETEDMEEGLYRDG